MDYETFQERSLSTPEISNLFGARLQARLYLSDIAKIVLFYFNLE